MFELIGLIIPLFIVLILVGIFLSFVPLGLWISAISAGVKVSIFSLVGMRHLAFCRARGYDKEKVKEGNALKKIWI